MLVKTCLAPHPCGVCCTKKRKRCKCSVLGMVAKGTDDCDNVSCSTSLRSMLYKKQSRCKCSVLDMVAKGMDAYDNVSCSTSLRGMLYKEAKML